MELRIFPSNSGNCDVDDPDENSVNHIWDIPLHFSQEENFSSGTIEINIVVVGEKGSEGATASTIWSRLVNPQGRWLQNFDVWRFIYQLMWSHHYCAN